MPAAMPKTRLYRAARRLAAAPTTNFDDLGRGVLDAVHGIVTTILRTVDAKVTAAATVGATQIDILRFHGNDLDDVSGFPMLTLVKGPRDTDLRAVSGPTLVEALEEALAPFEVVHTWHARSNMNRIILRWHGDVPRGDGVTDDDDSADSAETVEETDEETDEEEEEDTAQSLLRALQKQLAAVESDAAGESMPRVPRTLPEIPEEVPGDEEQQQLLSLQASLQSLLLRALK
jgi:hypothetical protein